LRRNELDAFLAQALSPKLYEAELLQDLKVIAWAEPVPCEECPGNDPAPPNDEGGGGGVWVVT